MILMCDGHIGCLFFLVVVVVVWTRSFITIRIFHYVRFGKKTPFQSSVISHDFWWGVSLYNVSMFYLGDM